MTVGELIEILKQYDKNIPVEIDTYEMWDDYDWDENLEIRYIPCSKDVEIDYNEGILTLY